MRERDFWNVDLGAAVVIERRTHFTWVCCWYSPFKQIRKKKIIDGSIYSYIIQVTSTMLKTVEIQEIAMESFHVCHG